MSSNSIDMTTNDNIPELDPSELRKFGLTTGAVFVVLFGLFFPWLFELNWPWWPWAIAAPLWLLGIVRPAWLRPVYRGWMRFGLLASRVMTPLILGIVFFGMITPMALVRRLRGSDPLQRTIDPQQKTYRKQSTISPAEKLEKPF